jgi:hypothetical protein
MSFQVILIWLNPWVSMHGDLVETYGNAEAYNHTLHPYILWVGTCTVDTYCHVREDW